MWIAPEHFFKRDLVGNSGVVVSAGPVSKSHGPFALQPCSDCRNLHRIRDKACGGEDHVVIDIILSMTFHESELENDYLVDYKAKAEYYVRQHQENEAIAKLKSNIPLTEDDVEELERILWSEVGTKQDYEREIGSVPLGEFVRSVIGLDMNAAKAAFADYLDSTQLDSRQIYFVNQIVEYIVHNGMMKDLSVLQDSPFTDQGSIVEVFTDLSVWAGIRKAIERVNANATVA